MRAYRVEKIVSPGGVLDLARIIHKKAQTSRVAAAVRAKRHPSSIAHTLRDLCVQRIDQIASI